MTTNLKSLWSAAAVLPLIAIGLSGCAGDGELTPNPAGTLIVASAGGTVTQGNGSVAIPANALAQDTRITVGAASGVPAAPLNRALVSDSAFSFGPDGTMFSTASTVTIHYNPATLPAGSTEAGLAIYTVDNGAWTPVAGSAVDAANDRVTAPVMHFSIYAILASTGGGSGNFELIDLGPVGNDQFSEGRRGASGGLVAFESRPFPGDFHSHTALWHNGMVTDLGLLTGFEAMNVNGVNENGDAVGQAVDAENLTNQRAWYYHNGQMLDLMPGETGLTIAYGINNQGQVVGAHNGVMFVWQNGVKTSISGISGIVGINSQGHLGGWISTSPGIWRAPGDTVEFGMPAGATGAFISGINDSDEAVGTYTVGTALHGFIYRNGAYTDLGAMSGGTYVTPNAINNHGEVVGAGNGSPNGAFLWKDGNFINLSTKIPPGSIFTQLVRATAITDEGYIIGMGNTSTGQMHGYILRPAQ